MVVPLSVVGSHTSVSVVVVVVHSDKDGEDVEGGGRGCWWLGSGRR